MLYTVTCAWWPDYRSVQNLWAPHLLSETIKTYNISQCCPLFCCYGMRPLILSEEHGLVVFEGSLPRRVFSLKIEKIIVGRRSSTMRIIIIYTEYYRGDQIIENLISEARCEQEITILLLTELLLTLPLPPLCLSFSHG